MAAEPQTAARPASARGGDPVGPAYLFDQDVRHSVDGVVPVAG